MDQLFVVIAILVLAGIGYIAYMLSKGANSRNPESEKRLQEMLDSLRRDVHDSTNRSRLEILENTQKTRQEMQSQLEKVNEQLNRGMSDSTKTLQQQFKQSSDIIKEVTTKLTKLDETNKQVVNFAEQMKSLEKILTNQKQRGILGEIMLDTLLSNIFPPDQYESQYQFENGDIVDAVVHFKDKLIPIDSKFSLENYNKIMHEDNKEAREKLEKEFKNDMKKTIDQTSKYIRPKENTTEFAFMFIPAEGIYYNLIAFKTGALDINSQNLIEYAFQKHVIIVSPTTFSAYLQTVLQGLKAIEMEKNVQEIVKRVGDLGKHLNAYQLYMQKLGNNLGTTVNMYNSASSEFKKIDKDVVKISGGAEKIGVELELLERPALTE